MTYLKSFARNTKKKAMNPKEKSILKNIVSLRVSDQEKETLEKITKASSMNVSEVIREAIDFWIASGQRFAGKIDKVQLANGIS